MDLVNKLIQSHLEIFKEKYVKRRKNYIEVKKNFIYDIDNFEIILLDYLSQFGYNYAQIILFINTLKTNSNKKFFADRYTLINDRKSFYIMNDLPEKIIPLRVEKIQNFSVNSSEFSVEKYSKSCSRVLY